MTDPDPTVLVTGSSSGLGRATAHRFRDAGWTVYATARDPADAVGLADRGCHTPALDVTDDAAVSRVVGEAAADGLDCLVNNAGFGQYGPVEDVPTDRLARQFDVNVAGPHRLCRAALPHLRECEGTIVTLSSLAAHAPFPGAGAYCASKAAVEAHHDALRGELSAAAGVDVVLVEPGFTRTDYYETAERTLSAVAGPESPYGGLYEHLETLADMGPRLFGSEPEAVADVIADAAEAGDPDARYPVGTDARLILLSRLLPDRVRDRLDRLVYGW